MEKNSIKIGFFGTPEYATTVLDKLNQANFVISFIVTMPDRPRGRKMITTAPPAKIWAQKHKIPVYQPEKLDDTSLVKTLKDHNCDVFVVIAYGKIIPDKILNLPKAKSLNIHGSLLPKLRGASPIESAILQDMKETGVTIMLMDSKMDHGPIIAQEKVIVEPWPPTSEALGNKIVETGANLLISILPDWLDGKIKAKDQDHSQASYTKKIQKEDGLIDLAGDPYKNYLKIQAYHGWPSAFFFQENKRVKITKASYKNGILTIEKVIPEGKKEMNYKDSNTPNS